MDTKTDDIRGKLRKKREKSNGNLKNGLTGHGIVIYTIYLQGYAL